jgi:hypothetical protein
MAHEKIYQITPEPLPVEEFITENDFIDHPFIGSISDGVSSRNIDLENEIRYFRKWLENMQKVVVFDTDNSFCILPGGKEKYFKNAFSKFSEAVKKAVNINLEKFSGDSVCPAIIQNISNSFCEKFGSYVSSDEFDTIPFDEFIRYAEINKRYYINGILDYHW